jgi:heat shock protein HslJ
MTRNRTRRPVAWAALLTVALVASHSLGALAQEGSAASEPIATDAIEGVTWQLQEQVVDGAMAPVPAGVVVTLLLEDGGIGGSGGCNSYFGSYTLDGDEVTFGEMGSTLIACEPPAGDVEAAYFANLETVATWFSDGGSLTLLDSGGDPVMRLVPADVEPMPVDSIEGLTWRLQEQAIDGQLAALPEGATVTLLLDAGQASGNGGCNDYFAEYTLDGTSLSFGEIGSTLMFCEGPGGEVETTYFANLALVASWLSDGESLTLSGADGNALLVYGSAPAAPVIGGWVASGINNGAGGVETTDITPHVTAIFDADGTLRGFDGCNNYSTIYTLDDEAVSISDAIVTTRMACESEALSVQSAQYFDALVASTSWALDSRGNLELRDGEGVLQVLFTPAQG